MISSRTRKENGVPERDDRLDRVPSTGEPADQRARTTTTSDRRSLPKTSAVDVVSGEGHLVHSTGELNKDYKSREEGPQ